MEKELENFRAKENFPVASILIPKQAREAIRSLYQFARSADEISDNFSLPNKEREKKLKELSDSLRLGEISKIPYQARDYSRSCKEGKMHLKHGLALLDAFIQDTRKKRYDNWEETLSYCQRSAATIGRSVLEACDEFEVDIKLADNICIVLQLINHLQDLKTDLVGDDRIYFDTGLFPELEQIKTDVESENVKKGKLEIISRLRQLLDPSKMIFSQINSFRVRSEIATIYYIAEKLLDKLSKENILSKQRVELTKNEKIISLVKGVLLSLKNFNRSKFSAKKIAVYSKSSFLKPLLKLDRQRKKAMLCFYSFCRLVDDVADNTAENSTEKLQFWRDEIEKIYSADLLIMPEHAISRELSLYVKKYNIEKEILLEIIEGQQMDISGLMLKPTQEVLDLYCYRVAGCVGLVSIQIFGYREKNKEKIIDFAINLGRALQYINIIRDVKEDASRGRIYLPKELLKKHGMMDIKPEDISNNYNDMESKLEPLLQEISFTADNFMSDALKSLPKREKANMKTALLMMKVYKKYLEKMRSRYFLFDREDIKLTLKEKFLIFYEPIR